MVKQPSFELNDVVRWTSQASGFSKKKEGAVSHVLPPGKTPQDFGVPSSGKGWGLIGRKHVSYVVKVQRAKSIEYFWPVVSKLELVRAAAAVSASVSEAPTGSSDVTS